MLFDGTVTLDENGEATITLDNPMKLGHIVMLTYDGDHEGIVTNSGNGLTINIGWGEYSNFLLEDTALTLIDDEGNPITGDVQIKLVQNGLPTLETLFDGSVELTDGEMSGTPVKTGAFEASRELGDGEAYFVIVGDDVKVYTSDPGAMWMDGAYMNIITSAGGKNWTFMTTDTSMTSVTLSLAVQDGGK